MKKTVVIILLGFFFIPHTFAYEPTLLEVNLLNRVEKALEKKTKIEWDFWLRQQIIMFEKLQMKVTLDRRKSYLVGEIVQMLKDIKNGGSNEVVVSKEGTIHTETDSMGTAKAFFDLYWQTITTGLSVSELCTKYFDVIDEIAKKNNFPTELIIATWGIEYGCKLWNPANWWGPFQITSQYYAPWDITVEEFSLSVQKYIDFTKGKWDYFNTNPYHSYKERFWNENINIMYESYTLRDLKLTAILYNWVSKNTTLDGNTFANANLNDTVSHASDGVVTRFLKVLNWKIHNK